MRKLICLLAVLAAIQLPSLSQQRLLNQNVVLKSCRISINANEFIATSLVELEYYNPKDIEVEGRQYFKLDRGEVITGFQLELNGKYRDGSIEEKRKASNAYNKIVGKRIDPAILQMIQQDHYTLNIYPIPAHSSRKVSLTIVQAMKFDNDGLHFNLPVNFGYKADFFSTNIEVCNNESSVLSYPGVIENETFIKDKTVSKLSYADSNVILNKPIAFSVLQQTNKVAVCFSESSTSNNFLLRFVPSFQHIQTVQSKSIAVFWDVSGSAEKRNIKAELSFLKQYIEANSIESARIFLFNQESQGSFYYSPLKKSFNYVERFISNYRFAGATQLSKIDFAVPGIDHILLFSDGVNTFGKMLPAPAMVPVDCIVSSDKFDNETLKKIVFNTGGRIINISKKPTVESQLEFPTEENFLVAAKSIGDAITINEQFPIEIKNPAVLLSGNLMNPDTLELVFGNNHSISTSQKLFIGANSYSCNTKTYEQLQMLKNYDSNMYDISVGWNSRLIFGLQNKVVTMQTSYLVLERTEDYILYNIAPPKELEQECAEKNFVYKNDFLIKALKLEDDYNNLELVAKNYNTKIQWWDKTLPMIDITKPVITDIVKHGNSDAPQQTTSTTSLNDARMGGTQELTTVVVTSLGQVRQKASLGYCTVTVRSRELINANPVNLQNGLTGKVSGLVVQTTNSSVFADTRITLRGIRSLTGNNQPILVIDGMPATLEMISYINPNDISYVTVLKSSAATALYGPEGVTVLS